MQHPAWQHCSLSNLMAESLQGSAGVEPCFLRAWFRSIFFITAVAGIRKILSVGQLVADPLAFEVVNSLPGPTCHQ